MCIFWYCTLELARFMCSILFRNALFATGAFETLPGEFGRDALRRMEAYRECWAAASEKIEVRTHSIKHYKIRSLCRLAFYADVTAGHNVWATHQATLGLC